MCFADGFARGKHGVARARTDWHGCLLGTSGVGVLKRRNLCDESTNWGAASRSFVCVNKG